MPKIAIVGAGITGMAIASMLSRSHEITIVARNLPGDANSLEWASPWAGACFLCLDGSNAHEQRMQADSLAWLWALAESHPESSVKRIEMNDFQDETPWEKIWYKDLMPGMRKISPEELPEGVKLGMRYQTVVLTPHIFLPWLRKQLERSGVKFVRKELKALNDLKDFGHDVLVNATGWGSKFLTDIADEGVQQIRGQTLLVRTSYDKIFMRHGKDYTYVIPRLDGTAIIGGIKQIGETYPEVDQDIKADILRRVHEHLPNIFPSPQETDFEIIQDNVGFRPGRPEGVRVEQEILGGEKIVHAYGTGGGGYVFSFGLARATATLVNDYFFKIPVARL
ncbi:nucleotide-binding domain-containing protein [Aaosphaeria arxii CBS 175.79]|uniref:Nucleotide-binding domain-containing protein n=1 Tax=Aaosphaeria arxii CBS 175.79 TaxID=1450172 RepID=A0A6A5Y8X3_9PLEO|nr:nucleotide-binding domain-containing protein [Aaosphaeria arxii CBS 175.79]KAF2021034.1 nucleotide-binding domain-containing protein [Aaosphaeria arxii CBS 175.79]